MSFNIIENFLPENQSTEIEDFLSDNNFPWFYRPSIGNKKDNQRFYFSHMFVDDKKVNSDFFGIIKKYIVDRLEFKILHRVKANLFVKVNENYASCSHVDYDFKHQFFSAIYYVNTNNGSTLLNDKISVNSIKNRLLIFDGRLPHRAISQTDTKIRMNINFVFEE